MQVPASTRIADTNRASAEIPAKFLNHLYRGPIEEVLSKLPNDSVDCIFADPDYNVGVTYQGRSFTTKFDKYIESCINWARECHRVLKPDGNFWIVNYPRNNSYLRVRYLDEAFYAVYENIWVYRTNIGQGPSHFTTAHRSILQCIKQRKNRFYKSAVAIPYQNPTDRRIKRLIGAGSPGRMPYSWHELDMEPNDKSWFNVNLVKNVSRSKSFHSCQIPERLSERLFRASTRPGDAVMVLFGGAGSELVVCQRLGLNWISAEIVPEYCDLIEARLKNAGTVPTPQRMLTAIRNRQKANIQRAERLTQMPID